MQMLHSYDPPELRNLSLNFGQCYSVSEFNFATVRTNQKDRAVKSLNQGGAGLTMMESGIRHGFQFFSFGSTRMATRHGR